MKPALPEPASRLAAPALPSATVLRRAQAKTVRERHLPGEGGTWILVLGDLTVFALFFAVYLHYRAADPELFARSQEHLNPALGAINTLLLLTSSLFVVTGVRAMRRRIDTVAPYAFAGAFACGVGFAFVKYLEYSDQLGDGLTLTTNDFFMFFYVLTALHFFHLCIGLGILAFLFTMSRRKEWDAKQLAFIEGGACFWHMVDMLWVVLFPLLYLVR